MSISRELAPQDTDENLRSYLDRMFTQVGLAIEQQDKLIRYDIRPNKLAVGQLYYFNAAIVGDLVVTTEGVYVYKSDLDLHYLG